LLTLLVVVVAVRRDRPFLGLVTWL
jgi:hypothetical protein